MAFAWKAAGLTYNRYLAVAARVVRRSLKDDKRLQAEKRGEMDLRFAKWEVCQHRLAEGVPYTDWACMKNGKQGENKSLAAANEAAMVQESQGQQ
ncbi:ubiquinol-cytochrome c reductase core subunit 1 [Thelotrema lepadinum]|nr:ubiquinol-cytochrome c reductase core subunit 1 [Thelotrema lepadinum]